MTPASAMPFCSSAMSRFSVVSLCALAVERDELLAGPRAADDNGRFAILAFGDEVIIKRVQRLADFEHHVIRHVHDVVDAADADFFQRASEANPGWPDFHAFDDAGGVTRAKIRIFEGGR
jgi:hypothetical protein